MAVSSRVQFAARIVGQAARLPWLDLLARGPRYDMVSGIRLFLAKGKLAQFIQQREKRHPLARKYRFRVVVKLMALNTPRAKRGGKRKPSLPESGISSLGTARQA